MRAACGIESYSNSTVLFCGLFLPKEAPSRGLIENTIRPAQSHIRSPSRILSHQRERLCTARICYGSYLMKHLGEPPLHRVYDAKVSVMLSGIGPACRLPVLVAQQGVAQHPHVP